MRLGPLLSSAACRGALQTLRDGREVCVYSISCLRQSNIDITLEWLTRHAKTP